MVLEGSGFQDPSTIRRIHFFLSYGKTLAVQWILKDSPKFPKSSPEFPWGTFQNFEDPVEAFWKSLLRPKSNPCCDILKDMAYLRHFDAESLNRHIPFGNGKRNMKTHCTALAEISKKSDNFPHARRTPKWVVWGLPLIWTLSARLCCDWRRAFSASDQPRS